MNDTMKRNDNDIDELLMLLVVALIVVFEFCPGILDDKCFATRPKKKRCLRTSFTRTPFDDMLSQQKKDDRGLKILLRMSRESFDQLVDLIKDKIEVDRSYAARRGGAITPEYCLFMTLRYLAGSKYCLISNRCNASKAAVYSAIEKTMIAIMECSELAYSFPCTVDECQDVADGFTSISSEAAITNCVGAIDGFLLPIKTPSKKEVGNVASYFSGHYMRSGINVQAICDSQCRFMYISTSSPGSVNDRVAYHTSKIGNFVEQLPLDYVILADAAYEPSEHCLPMYYGVSRHEEKYDAYNYYASQLRIRIEMCFGMMTQKFELLDAPVRTHVKKTILIMHTISRLHNYCINERLRLDPTAIDKLALKYNREENKSLPTVQMDENGDPVCNAADEQTIYRAHGNSITREVMAASIFARGLKRNVNSCLHKKNIKTVGETDVNETDDDENDDEETDNTIL